MENYSILHQTNIIIHVLAGSIALLLGVIAILTKKGGTYHKKSGKLFLGLLVIVILTGLMGVFLYGRNTFLLVITVLSCYLGFSGYRVLQNKHNVFKVLDLVVALFALTVVAYFLYYFKSIGMIWSPIIIYSTVGYLCLMVTYDLLRYFIPRSTYRNMWLYEHIIKMVSAFSAILSAFAGTVFENQQPYSQFLPSVFGSLLSIGFIMYYFRKNNKKPSIL